MGGGSAASGVNGEANVLTFIEPDFPGSALLAANCILANSGFASSFVFSKPLIAPIFHFYNLDAARVAITGTSTTGSAVGLTTIVKNNLLDVSGTTLNDTVQPATALGCNSNAAGDTGNGACGSFRVTAASGLIQTLSLNNNAVPSAGASNDGHSWTVSFPTAPLTKQFSPATIVAGGTSQLIFSITNPNQSASVTLTPLDFTDNLPAGVTVASATATNNGSCGSPTVTNGSGGALAAGATSIRASNISIAPGATCTISVPMTATAAGGYTNNASNMSSSVGNLIPGGSTTLTVTPVADLAITKDDGQPAYTPGGTVIYNIVVTNNGPGNATGAQVSDPLPAGISTASWTCGNATGGATCGVASGTGGINTTANLPAGSSVTYTLSMTTPIGFSGNLTNTAAVTAPAGVTDSNQANNTASDTDTQFTSPPGPGPGACNIATNGSFESPNIQTDPQGPGDNTAYINGYATYRTGTTPISGWQTVSGTRDILRNYTSTDGPQSIDLYGVSAATLRQTFTGLVAGQQYTFSIDYSGHSAAQSAGIIQLGNGNGVAPVTLATLRPAADSISNGSANFPTTPLYSATWSTFRYTFVAAGTEATIQIANTGVAGTTGTGLFIDNFSFAGDAPCETDLAITKDDGEATYTPGLDTNYTIVVTNNGPGPVGGAQISDPLPAGITNASWTCSNVTGGGVCGAASGTGAISTTATLPVGASVTYTLSMGIPGSYSGNLVNTATVTVPTGVTEIDDSNNQASDTDTMAPPPFSGACAPRDVVQGNSFTFAPLPVTGTVTKTGSVNGWQANPNAWYTFGGNYAIEWTFSQPVPARWFQFTVVDIDPAPNAQVTVSVGGSGVTAAQMVRVAGNLVHNGSGVISRAATPAGGQSGTFRFDSNGTITSLRLTGTNIVSNDYIGQRLYVRPSCMTVQKVSEGGTGSFQINMSNVAQVNGTAVPSTTLVTTTAGTAVSSPRYFAPRPGTDLILSEVVPANWNVASAVCTDRNAGGTGNPTVIGSFTAPTLTIPGANVRPESDIQCTFTNLLAPALTIEKTGTLNDSDGDGLIDLGETISYSFRVENTGGTELTGATVNDPLLTNAGISVTPGPQTLAPGGAATFTATYTPTQADIDAGQVSNTAAGTGTPPSGPPIESPPVTVVVPPEQTPALTIDKTGTLNDGDGDGLIDLGETISYSFRVRNTGTLTLTSVTVNDPLLTNAGISVTPGPQTLAPGGIATFTATYTPTQAQIDAGSVENTATGTGTPPSGPPIDSPPVTVTVPPDQTPALAIEKTGTLNDNDGDGLIDLGETITYSFRATNTGAVTLSGVTVNDPLLQNAGLSVSPGPQTLAPGGTATFSATYTPTQADIDAGQVSNTAIGTGTPPSGPPIDSPPVTVVVPPDQTPALDIEKTGTLNDADGDGLIDLGETISYSFRVRNTGTLTLTGVTVNDPLLTNAGISVSPGPQTLAPGGTATFTATYTPTQADIDAGQVTNTATGTGTPPSGPTITSPPDTVTVPPDQASGLTIDKTGTLNDLDGDDLIDLGETISYSFLVTNTGAVTLTGVTINDPLVTVDQGPQTLAPGANFTFTATYTPTQADIDAGQVTNTATGSGTPPSGPPIDSPPDTAVVPPDETPGLTIDKTGTLNDSDGDGLIDLGETISYSFLATNTGAVTLTGVTVIDPLLDNAGIAVTPGPQTLAPGGTATFTATYTPTQAQIDAGQVSNTATGTGTPPSGPPIDSPPVTVVVPPDQTPALIIDKTGSLNDADGDGLIDLGETISYSFLARNTGTVTLTGVTVNDPLLANAGISVSPGPQTLAPRGSVTFTATYTPTQADIDAGQVSNTAAGTGTPPSGPPIDSPPVTVVVPPDQAPALTIDKTGTLNDTDGDGLIDLGETISYSFLVRNTGTVTLTGVTVNDSLLSNAGISVSPGPQTLSPRGTATFTATYTPTQADIDEGQVSNTAIGTGTPPSGPPIDSPPDTATVPPDQAPALTIDKTGTLNDTDGDGLIDLGETISYAFRVQNTGTVTMTSVTVNDPLLVNAGISVTPGPQTLAPRGVATFTATYTPTQADIDAGRVENTATGTGTDPDGGITDSPPDTVTVPPEQTSGLVIDKTGTLNDGDGDGFIDPGETITYTFLAENTGTVTLTGVTVNDPLLANAGISVTPGPQTLAPDGTATFTATYTPTQADIDAGRVVNTATGTGTDPDGGITESPPDTVTVPPDTTSGLTVEKTGTLNDGDGDGHIDLGETISYSFRVRNTGAVTLTGVTVNDPLLTTAGISVTPGPQTLAPGGTVTFTAEYTPTQAEIDTGRVENTATGTGTPPSGPPIESPPDTVSVPPQPASLSLQKTGRFEDIDGNGHANPGDTLTYSFTVTNDGGQTINDVLPQDAGPTFNGQAAAGSLSDFEPGPVTLAPREQMAFTATYTLTEADIVNAAGIEDGVENTATAIGYVNGNVVTGTPVASQESTVAVALPAAALGEIAIAKVALLRHIRRGEEAPFAITVSNLSPTPASGLTVVDTMPSGFRFVSASINGVEATPVVEGLRVIFENVTVPGNSEIEIRLRMLALSSAGPGEHVNRANVTDTSGNRLAPEATASVEILVEPVFDCGDIIGKVFDDENRNGYQDQGELGLPGVRVATVNGWLVTTDAHGRFHVPCAALPDQRIGSNFIMKLDTRTLPTGYRLTTENPRVVRLTAGKMTELNFGASIGRVVRLDLQDAAFEPGRVELRQQWTQGLDQLIAFLAVEQSVLRLTYIEAGADPELAGERLKYLSDLIGDRWRQTSGQYRLEIETRVEMGL